MGKRWQRKRKNDHFYKKAKKEGYRGRAAYKLSQLDRKYNLIGRGDVVVDLGSAPGAWLQIAREKIGHRGYVLGVDLEQIEDLGYENVETIKADMTDPKSKKIILDKIQGSADVVISDASPNITGTWDIDHARSMELCKHALEIAKSVLRQDGSFLAKAFQGEFFRDFLKDVGKSFEFHKASKPKASREKSAETYVVGKGYIG